METQEAPVTAPEEAAPAPLAEEAVQLADQVALGIEYTETFTLARAIESYNATRQDVKNLAGDIVLDAEKQQLAMSDKWLAKYGHDKFTLRRASHYDGIKMRVRYSQLTENLPVDAWTAGLIDATTVCEQLIVDTKSQPKPAWFDLDKLNDSIFAMLVNHWYQQWSARFRKEDD